jgi:hypothetical protein
MIATKSKTAAWFVSNCQTVSKREVYVARMQKYIDVDIYGTCGTYQCSREKDGKQCDAMLQKQYWWVVRGDSWGGERGEWICETLVGRDLAGEGYTFCFDK